MTYLQQQLGQQAIVKDHGTNEGRMNDIPTTANRSASYCQRPWH